MEDVQKVLDEIKIRGWNVVENVEPPIGEGEIRDLANIEDFLILPDGRCTVYSLRNYVTDALLSPASFGRPAFLR